MKVLEHRAVRHLIEYLQQGTPTPLYPAHIRNTFPTQVRAVYGSTAYRIHLMVSFTRQSDDILIVPEVWDDQTPAEILLTQEYEETLQGVVIIQERIVEYSQSLSIIPTYIDNQAPEWDEWGLPPMES